MDQQFHQALSGYHQEGDDGRDQLDLIRTRLKDVFADPDTFERKLLAAYEDNTYTEHFECHVLPAEGRKERWLEHRSQPIISGLYAGGRVEHYYGITSRRKAEAARAESQEKLRAIFDNAADGILLADVETGSFVECNDEICRMLGYSRSEMLTLSVGDIHPPEDLEWVRDVFRRQFAREMKTANDIPVLRKDGSVFFAGVSSGPVTLDGKGYLVGLFHDATVRKQAEEDLRRSEKNWEAIFQSIGHPTIVLSPSMTVMEANNATVQATGLPLDELRGKRCWEIFHGPQTGSPPSCCPFAGVLQSGEVEVREMEVEMLGGWYLVSCTPIFSEDGELAKVIHIATDITARRTIAEQLRQSQKMEAVGVLAGGIAHDFNNILQAVRGYAEIAIMGADPHAGTVKHLNGILAAVEHGARITGQMLAFSRKQVFELKILDMNEVVRGLTDFLRRIIGGDITLSTEYEEGPLLVEADSSQIQQVLMNLAVNAREAMPGGGQLFIETSGVLVGEEIAGEWEQVAPGPYAMFSVVDTGCGIEDEHKDHIFEPFYTTKGREKGTGLGLSTVFGIISQHGGFIRFSSEPGEGTAFRVYLPIAEQGEKSAKVPDAAMPPVRGAGQVVLVVEDEEMVRELTEAMLHSLGYRVITAATPGECIDLVSGYDGPIHLLLSDVVMPGMNGPQLYKTLRKMRPDIPALFMSGYPDIPESFERPDGDARNFLQKPFTIEMLAAAVGALLGGAESPGEL
ncbi:MAG: PAS domain S-box protein [bacterium]|nr:PAS domain S-box protein [bacterium]